jgi:hypothetical protein
MNFIFYHLYIVKIEILEECIRFQELQEAENRYRKIKTDLLKDISDSAKLIKKFDKIQGNAKKDVFRILNTLIMAFLVDSHNLLDNYKNPEGKLVFSRIYNAAEILNLDTEKEEEFFSQISDMMSHLEYLTDLELRKKLRHIKTPDQIIKEVSNLEKELEIK